MALPRNILFILTDQHRWDMLGCYGHSIVRTPCLDALCRDGMRFDCAFTPTAICQPARASLLTGVFPCRHGVRANTEGLSRASMALNADPDLPRLPERLPGYEYFHLGKWHAEESRLPRDYGGRGHDFAGYGFPGSGLYRNLRFAQGPEGENRYAAWLAEKGFDIPTVSEAFFGNNPRLQQQELMARMSGPAEAALPSFIVDEGLRLLQTRNDPQRPFFMWMNFWGPHTPCLLPEPYYSMYDPASIPVDPAYAHGLEGKPTHFSHISKMWGVHDLPWTQWQQIIARYYGYITMIDDAVGRLLAYLKATGLYDDTLIVMTADHGDAMGAHRLIEKGEFMYDTCYRIPMIARLPGGVGGGRVSHEFVYLHDLYPTAVELATGTAPDMAGHSQSLLPLLRGDAGAGTGRDFAYAEFSAHFASFPQRMLRTRIHKFVFNACSRGELYDLVVDPHEVVNQIDSQAHREIKLGLIRLLLAQMEAMHDPLRGWLDRIQDFY